MASDEEGSIALTMVAVLIVALLGERSGRRARRLVVAVDLAFDALGRVESPLRRTLGPTRAWWARTLPFLLKASR